MSFYLSFANRRGRPTRFEERDHAVITAIAMMLDARRKVRGRHPDNSSLVVTTQSDVTTVADSLSGLIVKIKDSVKVSDAHKSEPVIKPKLEVAENIKRGRGRPRKVAALTPVEKEVVPATMVPKPFVARIKPTVDLNALAEKTKAKIAALKAESEQKNLNVTAPN